VGSVVRSAADRLRRRLPHQARSKPWVVGGSAAVVAAGLTMAALAGGGGSTRAHSGPADRAAAATTLPAGKSVTEGARSVAAGVGQGAAATPPFAASGAGGGLDVAAPAPASTASGGPAGSDASVGSGASAGLAGASGSSRAAGEAIPNEVPPLATKVVKTGSISVTVKSGQLGDTLAAISSRVVALGGFVSGTTMATPTDSAPPSGSLTLRVPVGSFETLVAIVEKTGSVNTVTTSGQDVTASSVDLQARVGALQDTRTQFEQVLARAVTIGDILSVESQISDLQTQIEQLQGQLQVLENQTSYSTLSVNVSERPKPGVIVKPPKPASGLEKAWRHARHTFASGVEAVIGATGGIAVFLVFASLLTGIGVLGWRLVRRRVGDPAAPPVP